MTPIEIVLLAIAVPLCVLTAIGWSKALCRAFESDVRNHAYRRIHRLEEVAEHHFRLARDLREANQSDEAHVRLALAASNAAWDVRRQHHLEEKP